MPRARKDDPRLHIGTSGWVYPHWRNVFYPKGVPQARWFEYYQQHFDTVEVNNTFYRLPQAKAVERWEQLSRPGFCLAVKGSRYITHLRRLHPEGGVATFFQRMRPLGEHLGPVLWQLPPNFRCDHDVLRSFLEGLPDDLTHVFEFRHQSWFTDATYEVLAKHDATLCLFDRAGSESPRVATAHAVYVRFHGPSAEYSGGYDDRTLRRWAARIRRWRRERREVWAYFNNDIGSHAVKDATRLARCSASRSPRWMLERLPLPPAAADNPRMFKGRFFYGWVIVAVMGATGALSMAMGTLNYGLFIKPMGDDLGIGRSVFGWAQTARQVASAITAPLVGNLIDRFGSRVLLALAAAITAVALIMLAMINEAWQLIALFAAMGLVGMAGPGALVTSVPVAKWFVAKRAAALSYMSLGIPVGGVIFIPLTQLLIDGLDWRGAWVVLALIGGGAIIPLSLIFVRRQPEDMGLLPDGASAPPPFEDNAQPEHDETSWTRAQAVRSSTFWRLVLVFSIVMLALSSVGVHRIPHFMDRGIDSRLVSYATALDAAAAGTSIFFMGRLLQHLPARVLGAGGFLLLALATFITIVAHEAPLMFVAMVVFGAGVGGLLLFQNFLWADYFGREHLGSIRGVVMPVTLIVGGIGAPFAGYVRDETGSYTSIWTAGMVLLLIGAALLVATPPPQRVAPLPERAPALSAGDDASS